MTRYAPGPWKRSEITIAQVTLWPLRYSRETKTIQTGFFILRFSSRSSNAGGFFTREKLHSDNYLC